MRLLLMHKGGRPSRSSRPAPSEADRAAEDRASARQAAKEAQEAAVRASLAADKAEAAAAEAAQEAYYEEGEIPEEPPTQETRYTLNKQAFPPPRNKNNKCFFFARDYPGLEDGIYTTTSLALFGVNPDHAHPPGILDGWAGLEGPARVAIGTGVQKTTIFWWA